MAFLTRRAGRGWEIIWHDRMVSAGRAGRKRAKVESGDHASAFEVAGLPAGQRGALAKPTNGEQRKKLLACYEALELERGRAVLKLGSTAPKFDEPMAELIDGYLLLVAYRATLRDEQPNDPPANGADLWRHSVRRKPMAKNGAGTVKTVLTEFRNSLPRGLPCDGLKPLHVARFLDRADHSAGTINRRRAYLRALFGALTTEARKARFQTDPREWFSSDIEALPEAQPVIHVATPAELVAFLHAAIQQRDRPDRVMVERIKHGKAEKFEQRRVEAAPLVEAALLLACTGLRRGEALTLTWDSINLDNGLLTIQANKTGKVRYLPLQGDPAASICPLFLELLRAWRALRPRDQYVLPDAPINGEALTRRFIRCSALACLPAGFGAQTMRRTFESALAAIGVPAGLCAFWTGHSVMVAERHYRAFIRERGDGMTVESVLSLTPIIEAELARYQASIRPRLVEGRA